MKEFFCVKSKTFPHIIPALTGDVADETQIFKHRLSKLQITQNIKNLSAKNLRHLWIMHFNPKCEQHQGLYN